MGRARQQTKPPRNAPENAPPPMEAPLIVVCQDQTPIGAAVIPLAAELGFRVEVISGCSRLFEFLHYMQPSAVISDLVLSNQDGFDVMKIVAGYNRDLPLLVVTSDPVLLGAVDAIEELWRLTNVWRMRSDPTPAKLAEFLQRSGVQEPANSSAPPGTIAPDPCQEAVAAE